MVKQNQQKYGWCITWRRLIGSFEYTDGLLGILEQGQRFDGHSEQVLCALNRHLNVLGPDDGQFIIRRQIVGIAIDPCQSRIGHDIIGINMKSQELFDLLSERLIK